MKTNSFPIIFVLSLFFTSLFASCSVPSQGIEVREAWVRATTTGGHGGHETMGTPSEGGMEGTGSTSAAYLTLINHGSAADRLLSVESDIAEVLELHESLVQNDIMTMRPVPFIEILPGQTVALKPGGLHIMLIGIKTPLNPGDKITLRLLFEKAGAITVQAEVRSP